MPVPYYNSLIPSFSVCCIVFSGRTGANGYVIVGSVNIASLDLFIKACLTLLILPGAVVHAFLAFALLENTSDLHSGNTKQSAPPT